MKVRIGKLAVKHTPALAYARRQVGVGLGLVLIVAIQVTVRAQMGPDGPGPGGPGAPPPPGAPGGRARAYRLSGVYALAGTNATLTASSLESGSNDVSAIYVSAGGDLTLTEPQISTTGNTSSQENSSFYGLNAAVLAGRGGRISLSGGSIKTSGSGANGAFATGRGAHIRLSKTTIRAAGPGAHGVMSSAGGTLTLEDVDITTGPGANSAAVATDRGGGRITVTRGTCITSGRDAPGLYSTGTLIGQDATFKGLAAEAAVIEGSNSILLTNCTLSGAAKCGVMIYQSFSGDAEGRQGVFTMHSGSLSTTAGPLFFVANTTGVIDLSGVQLATTSGVLVQAAASRWGRTGSNGGHARLTVTGQVLTGDLKCDDISSIAASLRSGSVLTGAVQGASLALDASSQWHVTADSLLAGLANAAPVSGDTFTNIVGHGHEVHYPAQLDANGWLGGKTYSLADGGRLSPLP